MKKISLLIILFIVLQATVYGQFPQAGIWQGNIHFSQEIVPFTFEISYLESKPVITLINWNERIDINESQFIGDSIFMPMHVFDAFISAKFRSGKMEGYWVKLDSIPFTARFNAPRFKTSKSKKSLQIENKINMTFSPPGGLVYPGIGLFSQQGNNITGTILTETGDYRYFEGIKGKNTFKMSTFDGVHAFMITGTFDEGKWQGEFHFDNGYVEKWTGYDDPEVELQDPFDMVELEKDTQRPYYDIIAPASGKGAIDPASYKGKVLIIQLFGTWCPNSFDETRYLVDWYKEYQKKGVEIVAVSYEVKYSEEYGLQRIEDYRKKMEIPWDIFLGGRVNKEQAAMAFPFLKRIQAFPTLVILDKKGFARYVNSYFLGPATGDYYIRFNERLNSIVEELLAE